MRQKITDYEELRKRIGELEISTDAQFSEIYQALTGLLSKKRIDENPRQTISVIEDQMTKKITAFMRNIETFIFLGQ